MTHSPFALALCQPGTERWLKAEVARLRPDLRAGFQSPGRVTFKVAGGAFTPEEHPAACFARAWACSAGSVADAEGILSVADGVGATHLWLGPADAGVPDEVPPARQEAFDGAAARWREAVLAAAPGRFATTAPRDGDLVLDVIVAPDEPALVGWHAHGRFRHLGPAGRLEEAVPADLPSRAWRKVHEGLRWARVPLAKGDLVLEFGAAPGGGTRAFVEAGARVLAVDPQPLSPEVHALPGVTFLRRPIGEVRLEELPVDVAWLACDAGIAPAHVFNAIKRLMPRLRGALRGFVLTLKLNDEATVSALPELLERLRALGCRRVEATQLHANRRDIFVFAER